MQTLRSDVFGRLPRPRAAVALGLLTAAAGACTGCSQPRSFLDNSVMLDRTREADRFWGPDGLAGRAPLAYRSPETPSPVRAAAPLVAQVDAVPSSMDLFPASYRSAPMPRSNAPGVDSRALSIVAAPASVAPTPKVITAANDLPPQLPARVATPPARIAAPPARVAAPPARVAQAPARVAEAPARVAEAPAPTVSYVTGRPRDDGLMLTSLEDEDALPPLPSASDQQPQTYAAPASTADADELPPLPPGAN